MAAPTLDDLQAWMGSDAPASPTASQALRLESAHAAAVESVEGRCLARYVDPDDDDFDGYPEAIRTAILLKGHRLYKRSSSPEGVAGFDAQGEAFRILASDPDIEALIGRYLRLDGFS